jgi:predicted secreted protein
MVSSQCRREAPRWWLAASLWVACSAATAQVMSMPPMVPPQPANVVQLNASGFKEVQQDWLTMSLSTTRDGPDAVTVQNQLKVALDAALAVVRPMASPQQMEVRTGRFSLYPRYGSNGRINGWQGTTELVLEGRDFARISTAAGRIQTLTMGHVNFSLSREAQQALEAEVQAMAIERFKQQAGQVARGFGFSDYSLREVSISSADGGGGPVRPRAMAMEAKAAMSDAPVAVEAGTSTVNVTVSGSIQLR